MTAPLITEEELTPVNSQSIDWFAAMSAVVGELDGLKTQVSALQAVPQQNARVPAQVGGNGAAEATLYGMLGTVLLVAGFVGYQALNRPDIAAIERSSAMVAESQRLTAEALAKKERPSVTCVFAVRCPEVPQEPMQATAPVPSMDALYRNPPAIPPEDFQTAIANVARWRQQYSDEQIAAFVASSSREQLGADPIAYQVTLTAFAGAAKQ